MFACILLKQKSSVRHHIVVEHDFLAGRVVVVGYGALYVFRKEVLVGVDVVHKVRLADM